MVIDTRKDLGIEHVGAEGAGRRTQEFGAVSQRTVKGVGADAVDRGGNANIPQGSAAAEGAAVDALHTFGQRHGVEGVIPVEGILADILHIPLHRQAVDLIRISAPRRACVGVHHADAALVGPDVQTVLQRVPGVVAVCSAVAGDRVVQGVDVLQGQALPPVIAVCVPGRGVGVLVISRIEKTASTVKISACGNLRLVAEEGNGRQLHTGHDGAGFQIRQTLREDDRVEQAASPQRGFVDLLDSGGKAQLVAQSGRAEDKGKLVSLLQEQTVEAAIRTAAAFSQVHCGEGGERVPIRIVNGLQICGQIQNS